MATGWDFGRGGVSNLSVRRKPKPGSQKSRIRYSLSFKFHRNLRRQNHHTGPTSLTWTSSHSVSDTCHWPDNRQFSFLIVILQHYVPIVRLPNPFSQISSCHHHWLQTANQIILNILIRFCDCTCLITNSKWLYCWKRGCMKCSLSQSPRKPLKEGEGHR